MHDIYIHCDFMLFNHGSTEKIDNENNPPCGRTMNKLIIVHLYSKEVLSLPGITLCENFAVYKCRLTMV